MSYLFITMRYSILKPHECRLIMLCLIIVLMKSLRGLSSESLDEYISIQHASVI